MLSFFELLVSLLTLSAAFGWLDHRSIHLPHSVGLLVMGLLASGSTVGRVAPLTLRSRGTSSGPQHP